MDITKEMEVTLLSKMDFYDIYVLLYLNHEISDFTRLLLHNEKNKHNFVTSSRSEINNNQFYFDVFDEFSHHTDKETLDIIVRPVINLSDNLFDQIININIKNGKKPKYVEFGIYPQRVVGKPSNIYRSDHFFTLNRLRGTSFDHKVKLKKHRVYFYYDRLFIRLKGIKVDDDEILSFVNEFVELSPIVWLVDYKEKRLISKDGLFSNIIINDKHDFDSFEETFLYRYLNNVFLPEIFQFNDLNLLMKKESIENNTEEVKDHFISMIHDDIKSIGSSSENGQKLISELISLAEEYLKYRSDNIDEDVYTVINKNPQFLNKLNEIESRISEYKQRQQFLAEEKDLISSLKTTYL